MPHEPVQNASLASQEEERVEEMRHSRCCAQRSVKRMAYFNDVSPATDDVKADTATLLNPQLSWGHQIIVLLLNLQALEDTTKD